MSQESVQLGERALKIMKDLADRIIPAGGPDYPGAHDIGLVDFMLSQAGAIPNARIGISIMLWMWELSPFLFSLKFKPFSKLKTQEQTEYMEKWEKSRFMWRRYALIGLKAVFMAFFYSDPRIWEKIGYKEECLQRLEEK